MLKKVVCSDTIASCPTAEHFIRMPPLLCAKSGLRFTCKPYPTHTMVIMMKKWFVVHFHTNPNPFLEFYIQKKSGLRWFAVVCGGLR